MSINKRYQWLFICLIFAIPNITQAFCGYYMARADSQLYNNSSKVVMARKDETTVITMVNDYQGEVKDFALLVPVPVVLKRNQIRITKQAAVEKIDAFSAPRLVKYYDDSPCNGGSSSWSSGIDSGDSFGLGSSGPPPRHQLHGVKVEASYSVGEYDISILSAQQSEGLLSWLRHNGYQIAASAASVLESYIKQDMRFFVAKVNLEKHSQKSLSYLRPLQIRFESKKFMLPIRLGMANAKEEQELYIFTLTTEGRVESTNYRSVKMPTNKDLPLSVEKKFTGFYKSLFDHQYQQSDKRTIFTEYAGNVSRCDPCATNPLSDEELRELGVFWLQTGKEREQSAPVYVTRLHLRYQQAYFPEDLMFQETSDIGWGIYQLRYVVHQPSTMGLGCKAGYAYVNYELPLRYEVEADNLAELTGENVNSIRGRLGLPTKPPGQNSFWDFISNNAGR